jgi:histidinol dehydrogenase
MKRLRGFHEAREAFFKRSAVRNSARDHEVVAEIVSAVRDEGDAALRRYSERFDGLSLDSWQVPPEAFAQASTRVADEVKAAISLAERRIRAFHERQPAGGFLHAEEAAVLGQLVRPIGRVACYVPAGTAPLFSTVLMTAVPARVAGVKEIVVATPPGPGGEVAPEILLAAEAVGVREVYRIGGAQAIAALAYGTETIPRVDKIVGPGNRFVVLAKQLVYGAVGIEALPGPTETLVLADESADPAHVAADLLAQAEHVDAQPVLVTPSEALLEQVLAQLDVQLESLPTAAAAKEALDERGYAVLVADLAEGVRVANLYAPEHLCLLLDDPWALLPLIENAGGVFMGHHSMEALGDYVAGPSHVMPTGGTARFASALNVRDFQKVIPLVSVNPALLEAIGPAGVALARAEGLEAHARAIAQRLGFRSAR